MLTVAVPKRNKLPNIIVLTPKDGSCTYNDRICSDCICKRRLGWFYFSSILHTGFRWKHRIPCNGSNSYDRIWFYRSYGIHGI